MNIQDAIGKFLDHQKELTYSKHTLQGKLYALRKFQRYAREVGKERIETMEAQDITGYLSSLRKPTRRGKRLSDVTRRHLASSLRVFLIYLEENELTDKALSVHVPASIKVRTDKPKAILSLEEIDALLENIGKQTLIAKRDCLIVEMLFNLGLRISELLDLKVSRIDLESEHVHIREAKGKKDRLVPMTQYLKEQLEDYLKHTRPHLLSIPRDEDYLILSRYGKRLSQTQASIRLKAYGKQIGIKMHSHRLRHSFAVHLLRGGMPMRYISEILGHAQMSTTQIYTQVSGEDLRRELETRHFYRELGLKAEPEDIETRQTSSKKINEKSKQRS